MGLQPPPSTTTPGFFASVGNVTSNTFAQQVQTQLAGGTANAHAPPPATNVIQVALEQAGKQIDALAATTKTNLTQQITNVGTAAPDPSTLTTTATLTATTSATPTDAAKTATKPGEEEGKNVDIAPTAEELAKQNPPPVVIPVVVTPPAPTGWPVYYYVLIVIAAIIVLALISLVAYMLYTKKSLSQTWASLTGSSTAATTK